MRVCPSADCDRAESMDGWKTDIRIVQSRKILEMRQDPRQLR